jgi:hypothetical protein
LFLPADPGWDWQMREEAARMRKYYLRPVRLR